VGRAWCCWLTSHALGRLRPLSPPSAANRSLPTACSSLLPGGLTSRVIPPALPLASFPPGPSPFGADPRPLDWSAAAGSSDLPCAGARRQLPGPIADSTFSRMQRGLIEQPYSASPSSSSGDERSPASHGLRPCPLTSLVERLASPWSMRPQHLWTATDFFLALHPGGKKRSLRAPGPGEGRCRKLAEGCGPAQRRCAERFKVFVFAKERTKVDLASGLAHGSPRSGSFRLPPAAAQPRRARSCPPAQLCSSGWHVWTA